jgi:hypothetical protein
MDDLKEIRKRVSELRKKVSGMPVSKASVDDLKAEIAHHEAGMKAIMRKQAMAEKKKGLEVITFPESQKKTTFPETKSPVKKAKKAKAVVMEEAKEDEAKLVRLVKIDKKATPPQEVLETKKEEKSEKPEKVWGKSRIIGL